MDWLVTNLMSIARTAILTVGGSVGLVKIIKGKSDEIPRDFNEGIFILIATGAIWGVTFAVQAIF